MKKRCPDCRRTKLAKHFYKCVAKKDGLASVCKKCGDVRRAEHRKRNPEATRAYMKAFRSTPEQKSKTREYAVAHKPQRAAATQRWREANWSQWLAGCARRRGRYRARKHEAFVEDVNREIVYYRGRMRCYLCGKKIAISEMHVDHVIPLSRGGRHEYANCKCACGTCNDKKGDKLLTEL